MKKVVLAVLLLWVAGLNIVYAAGCPLPLTEFNGICVEPTRPCMVPPKNVFPGTCIDAIENGILIEQVYFNCLPGYSRNGKQCLNPCPAPMVPNQGQCVNPYPPCQNPPANVKPGSCVDFIEGEKKVERYNFACLDGYRKEGVECVNPCPAPYVPYANECRTPYSPCLNPPRHAEPLSCFDRIENGVRVERSIFNCSAGYLKKGEICESVCPAERTFYKNECVDPSPLCQNPPDRSIPGSCHDLIQDGIRLERAQFECEEGSKKEKDECVDLCDQGKTYYQGACVDPRPECEKAPDNSVEGSCHDKIEDGKRIERFEFECLLGYKRQEKECVSVCDKGKTEVGGQCVPQYQYCRNWPEHAAACVDRIEKEARIERVSIRCLPAFNLVGGQCEMRKTCPNEANLDRCGIEYAPCLNPPKNASLYTCEDLIVEEARSERYRYGCPAGMVRGEGQCVQSESWNRLLGGSEPLEPIGFDDSPITMVSARVPNPFPDTYAGTLGGRASSELYYRGVINGYPDGEFKGDQPVNRAEAAKFLLLARFNGATERAFESMFPDVEKGDWFSRYVIAAASERIIDGYPDGYYRPVNTVNTAEFLKIFVRTFEIEEGLPFGYSDVKQIDWFARYAGAAEKYDLLPNRSGNLEPGREMTRYEVAIAIYQYLSNRD
jgi:hypothetical protein